MRLQTTHGPAGAENTKDGIIFFSPGEMRLKIFWHMKLSALSSLCVLRLVVSTLGKFYDLQFQLILLVMFVLLLLLFTML